MKFWLLVGAAVVAVLFGVNQVVQTVEEWGRGEGWACGPGCVAWPSPWSQGELAFGSIVVSFALGAVFLWLAAQARRTP